MKSFYPFFSEKQRDVSKIIFINSEIYRFFSFLYIISKTNDRIQKIYWKKKCRSWRALFRDIFNFSIWQTFNWYFTFRLWTILLPISVRKCRFMIGSLNWFSHIIFKKLIKIQPANLRIVTLIFLYLLTANPLPHS